ncbi:hypothetical protein [Asanoa siamensis]|uniref:hypothetical protein n=1 Tax=Asanoa siamensis TaxID=926357 RepID=UPI001944A968|nr:hypothetical protein [Asanoa siamensis]
MPTTSPGAARRERAPDHSPTDTRGPRPAGRPAGTVTSPRLSLRQPAHDVYRHRAA